VLLQGRRRRPLLDEVEDVVVEGRRVQLEVRHGNHTFFLDGHLLVPLHGLDEIAAVLRLGLELHGDADGLGVEVLEPARRLLWPSHDRLHEVGELVEVLHLLRLASRRDSSAHLRVGDRVEAQAVKGHIGLTLAAGHQKHLHLLHQLAHVVGNEVLLQGRRRRPLLDEVEDVVVEGRRVQLEMRHTDHALLLDCDPLVPLHGLDEIAAVLRLGFELHGDADGLGVEVLEPARRLLWPSHDPLHEIGELTEVLHGLGNKPALRDGYGCRAALEGSATHRCKHAWGERLGQQTPRTRGGDGPHKPRSREHG